MSEHLIQKQFIHMAIGGLGVSDFLSPVCCPMAALILYNTAAAADKKAKRDDGGHIKAKKKNLRK